MKTYKVSKREMVKEHQHLIQLLKRAGLKSDAAKQSRELKQIKKK